MTGFEGQQRHLTGFWNGFLTKNAVFRTKLLQNQKTCINFALANKPNVAIAQLVEQRTENPCVPGSIPGGTTNKRVAAMQLSCCLPPMLGIG